MGDEDFVTPREVEHDDERAKEIQKRLNPYPFEDPDKPDGPAPEPEVEPDAEREVT